MKTLIILRGISGTGKSKLAERLKKDTNAVVFSTDDFFDTEQGYAFDPTKLIEYHLKNIVRTYKALLQGVPSVLIDNTNTKLWEMKPYVLMAKLFDYNLRFCEPVWAPELKDNKGKWNVTLIADLQKREDRVTSGKSLPIEKIQKMSDTYDYYLSVDKIIESSIPDYILEGWKKIGGGIY